MNTASYPCAEEVVHGVNLADDGVQLDLDAQFLQRVHLRLDDGLRQAELRDAVDQHAAGFVERLEDRHAVSEPGEVAGASEARRPGADDGDAPAVARRDGRFFRVGPRQPAVGREPLQAADGHRVVLLPQEAVLLALVLLRADAAADRGEGVVRLDDAGGAEVIALADGPDELRDFHVHRAPFAARRLLALEAALRLEAGRLLRVTVRHLAEVLDALRRRLLRHRLPGRTLLGISLLRHSICP